RCRVQNRLLLVVQLVPGRLVDQDRHFRRVETRVDAILGLFIPAEVEDAGDGPTVAVDHAAIERSVNLTRRSLYDRCAQRLKEIAIDRGNSQLQAGEIEAADAFVQVKMKG